MSGPLGRLCAMQRIECHSLAMFFPGARAMKNPSLRQAYILFCAFTAVQTSWRVCFSPSRRSKATRWLVGLSLCLLLIGIHFCSPAAAQTVHFSGAVSTLGGGFNEPAGEAVDGSGNAYVADSNNNAVKEIPAGCSCSQREDAACWSRSKSAAWRFSSTPRTKR